MGTLWFCFADMAPPREANYGIVSADGVPYNDFLKYCWEVNSHRYKLIDCLREHPLDLSDVYDPLRNVNWRDRFEVFDD